MKKTNYILFNLIVFFTMQNTFAVNPFKALINKSTKKEPAQKQELFDFENLPNDLQNNIIQIIWSEKDNLTNFYKTTSDEQLEPFFSTSNINDTQIPILFYTLLNKFPRVKKVGYIVKKHQNSTNNNSSETALQLLLHNPKTNSECYSPFINSTDVKIHSAAFSVLGNIAITWQKSDHFYVTMYELNNVKKNNELDLSINAIPLTDLSDQLLATDKNSLISAKVSMFLLDGSQLGIKITYKTSPPIVSSTFTKFIPIHQAPLTPAEKVKRLGIPTKDALQLVRKDKKEKYSKSMQ